MEKLLKFLLGLVLRVSCAYSGHQIPNGVLCMAARELKKSNKAASTEGWSSVLARCEIRCGRCNRMVNVRDRVERLMREWAK